MFGGLNSNCLTNFGMVINITAASAAFLVPTQAEGKFDPEQLEKAATKKGGSRAANKRNKRKPI